MSWKYLFYGYGAKGEATDGTYAVKFTDTALTEMDRREIEDALFDVFDLVEWTEAGHVAWLERSSRPTSSAVQSVMDRVQERFPIHAVVNHYARQPTGGPRERDALNRQDWPDADLLDPDNHSYYREGNKPKPGSKKKSKKSKNSRSSSRSSQPTNGRTQPRSNVVPMRSATPTVANQQRRASTIPDEHHDEGGRPSERASSMTSHTWRLVNMLLQSMMIDLVPGATPNDVADDLAGVFTHNMSGQALLDFLVGHPAIEEVYLNGDQLQSILNVW